jgi:hypothetical protein
MRSFGTRLGGSGGSNWGIWDQGENFHYHLSIIIPTQGHVTVIKGKDTSQGRKVRPTRT